MEKLFLPVPDPFGILEKLTNGTLKDPIRAALKGDNPFSGNPRWLPADKREELTKKYGHYATRTAEEFAPVGDLEAVEAFAKQFQERIRRALIT